MTRSSGPSGRSAASSRRPRLTLEEVEDRVMRTAHELLIGETGGLTVSLEHINLEVIIGAAGVPRSSAHRRWPTKDDFVVDFLCNLAGPNWFGTAAFDPETIRVAIGVVQQQSELLATEEGRWYLTREAVRVGAKQNFEKIVESVEWRTYVALTATVMSIPDEETRNLIQEKLRASESGFIERMTRFYAGMASVLGFRARPPYTFEHLAGAGAAIVEGLALRAIVSLDLVRDPLQLQDPDGLAKEWTLAAAGFLAILESIVEPDPHHTPLTTEQIAEFAAASSDDLVALIVGEPL